VLRLLRARVLQLRRYQVDAWNKRQLHGFLAFHMEFVRLLYRSPFRSALIVFNCESANLTQLVRFLSCLTWPDWDTCVGRIWRLAHSCWTCSTSITRIRWAKVCLWDSVPVHLFFMDLRTCSHAFLNCLVLVYSMPWLLRGAWSMVSSILPPNAHRRIQFLTSPDELYTQMDRTCLSAGGTVAYFTF
jgi:hypothetical protein